MKRHTKETKSCIITRCTSGETVQAVSKSTGIPRSTIYHWIKNPPLSKKEETAKIAMESLKATKQEINAEQVK